MDLRLNRVSRRQALIAGAASVAGAGLASTALGRRAGAAIRTRAGAAHPDHARNVIFMCADGMSTGTLTLGDSAIRRQTGASSAWVRLWHAPGVRRAMQDTASADSLVTDSSAAASAWGIGRRVNNGTVNFTPDNREPEPILVTARAHGKATGLVTTTRVTHATPAGFIANVPDRGLEGPIAEQMQQRGVDVVLGGGRRYFPDATLAIRAATLCTTAEELGAAPGGLSKPLLGLFKDGHVDYVIERPATQPGLEAMTRAALDRLATGDNGFVLQVEGGRVDHAAHANDAAALVGEQVEFDRTIRVVVDWCAGRDDTLVVITSDHANANPGLTLYGPDGASGMERLLRGRRSIESILEEAARPGVDAGIIDRVCALIGEHRGIEFGQRERDFMLARFRGQPTNPFAPLENWTSLLGALLANHYGVAFVSPNHTSDYVECTAFGPGSQEMPPMVLNTDLYRMMVGALDIVAG
ncbi:MAG: alkaline phosphatase [Phycisphaeraceae bacterium]|nr:alkaline phosphatase [Phycisphaeraceae bacterium]